MKDLILLVADKNAQFALKGALGRPEAMGIRPIEFAFIVHSGRDGGARKSGPELLALEGKRFSHCLLIFDFEGCGSRETNPLTLEAEMDGRLAAQWNANGKAIVIEPEVDAWIWGADNAIESVIRWPSGPGVRDWLRVEGFTFDPHDKPERPKEAMETALRRSGIPRSSALYQAIAEKISLKRCRDKAFNRMREQLVSWFPR